MGYVLPIQPQYIHPASQNSLNLAGGTEQSLSQLYINQQPFARHRRRRIMGGFDGVSGWATPAIHRHGSKGSFPMGN